MFVTESRGGEVFDSDWFSHIRSKLKNCKSTDFRVSMFLACDVCFDVSLLRALYWRLY